MTLFYLFIFIIYLYSAFLPERHPRRLCSSNCQQLVFLKETGWKKREYLGVWIQHARTENPLIADTILKVGL